MIDDDHMIESKQTGKKMIGKNKMIIGILKKESLEQHNLQYEKGTPHVSVCESTETIGTTNTEEILTTTCLEPETTRTITTQSSSDKYTYISENVRPLIARTPTWFGDVLLREFIPPGPPRPSSRSFNRLSRSAGISQRLKRQLRAKAVLCSRGGITPSETKHISMITSC